MLPPMRRRTTFVRCLALVWATLQLASPGLSAIADGLLARASASGPSIHVEATSGASCPVVHSPDCAVCRYLSVSASSDTAAPAFGWAETSQCGVVPDATTAARSAAFALPHGRGPPTV